MKSRGITLPEKPQTASERQRLRVPPLLEQQQIKVRCSNDVVYWVNNFCYTYDPRESEPDIPFKLFPRQEEFLLWLQEREQAQEDGVAEKCRDVGFTWLTCVYVLHGWLFRKRFAAGFGSRKLELVDKLGDMDSILEKVRYCIRMLPAWMRPIGYKEHIHAGFCKLLNPETGSSITGEGGDNIGRGGRKSIYIIDEHAFLARPKKVEAALSQTSRVKIRVSTPNGMGNEFYVKRFGGVIKVFTFGWKDDPRKSKWELLDKSGLVIATGHGVPDMPDGVQVRYPWYEKQKLELDEETLASEVDIDYSGSKSGLVIEGKWVRAATNLILHPRFKAVYPKWEPHGPVVSGLDVSGGGKNKTVYVARRSLVVDMPVTWPGTNGIDTAHRAADEVERVHGRVLHYDAIAVGFAVQSAFESTERQMHFERNAVLGGERPTDDTWPSGKASVEMFVNYRAELAWKMRSAFEKTWEFVEKGVLHPAEEMISIPQCRELHVDLNIPLFFRTETGKIKIESKEAMKKRGVASPDYFDALMYTFAGEGTDWEGAAEAIRRSQVANDRLRQQQRPTNRMPKTW